MLTELPEELLIFLCVILSGEGRHDAVYFLRFVCKEISRRLDPVRNVSQKYLCEAIGRYGTPSMAKELIDSLSSVQPTSSRIFFENVVRYNDSLYDISSIKGDEKQPDEIAEYSKVDIDLYGLKAQVSYCTFLEWGFYSARPRYLHGGTYSDILLKVTAKHDTIEFYKEARRLWDRGLWDRGFSDFARYPNIAAIQDERNDDMFYHNLFLYGARNLMNELTPPRRTTWDPMIKYPYLEFTKEELFKIWDRNQLPPLSSERNLRSLLESSSRHELWLAVRAQGEERVREFLSEPHSCIHLWNRITSINSSTIDYMTEILLLLDPDKLPLYSPLSANLLVKCSKEQVAKFYLVLFSKNPRKIGWRHLRRYLRESSPDRVFELLESMTESSVPFHLLRLRPGHIYNALTKWGKKYVEKSWRYRLRRLLTKMKVDFSQWQFLRS